MYKIQLHPNAAIFSQLAPNGIPFGAKSIGNVKLESKFGLD